MGREKRGGIYYGRSLDLGGMIHVLIFYPMKTVMTVPKDTHSLFVLRAYIIAHIYFIINQAE